MTRQPSKAHRTIFVLPIKVLFLSARARGKLRRTGDFCRICLGRHRGHPVVAVHPCGDVCPQYTRRIIHYDVTTERCAAAGGVVVEELMPMAIAVQRKPYCKPAVLARGGDSKPR